MELVPIMGGYSDLDDVRDSAFQRLPKTIQNTVLSVWFPGTDFLIGTAAVPIMGGYRISELIGTSSTKTISTASLS